MLLRSRAPDLTSAPRATETPPEHYSPLEMEAALCVWEDLLERCNPLSPRYDGNVNNVWAQLGAVEFRHASIDLGRYCLKVYDLIPEDTRDGHSYDWDIIPAILSTIDWATGYTAQLPPEEAAAIVTTELLALDQPQRHTA